MLKIKFSFQCSLFVFIAILIGITTFLLFFRLPLTQIFVRSENEMQGDHKGKRETPSCKDQRHLLGTKMKAPWLVKIRMAYVSRELCKGALVTPKWVVTVAHCLVGQPKDNLKIVTAADETRHLSNITIHPHFDISTHKNDIALIEIQRSVTVGEHSSPICPQKKNQSIYCKDNCYVGDWTDQSGSMSLMDEESCRQEYEKLGMGHRVDSHVQCMAKGEEMGENCKGKSGSPLTCLTGYGYRVLTGVLSLGWNCARLFSPAIFTKISEHYDWIREQISGSQKGFLDECAQQGGSRFIKGYRQDDKGLHLEVFIPNKFVNSKNEPAKKGSKPGGGEGSGGGPGKGSDLDSGPLPQRGMTPYRASHKNGSINAFNSSSNGGLNPATKRLSYYVLNMKADSNLNQRPYKLIVKPPPDVELNEKDDFLVNLKLTLL